MGVRMGKMREVFLIFLTMEQLIGSHARLP